MNKRILPLVMLLLPLPLLAQQQTDRLHGRGASTFDQYSNTATIVIAGATPSVAGGNVFKTANGGSTTVTNFLGGVDTQQIVILCGDGNTTIQNNANIVVTGGADFICATNVGISFVFDASQSKWIENGGTGTGGGGGGGSPGPPTNCLQKNNGSGAFVAARVCDDAVTTTIEDTVQFVGPTPYFDLMRWGGYSNASPPSTTANCVSGSPNVTLAAAQDFKDASKFPGSGIGNGIVLYTCGPATGLHTPPAPTATPYGLTGGATTYTYKLFAEDTSGGLTAISGAGTTTTGPASLGINNVTLTAAAWNSTLNGEQVYTCSSNCNLSDGAQVSIFGFTTSHFNGQYTIVSHSDATHFMVYSPVTPLVTSESHAATASVLAINVLTLPALSVPNTIETGTSDTVIRYWVCRNGVLAFAIQQRDAYYEDAGVNIGGGNIPSYVPTNCANGAVNKYLATTIVSGGGTTSIVVANAAGATVNGVTALHDNSQNLLAALSVSRASTPVYISQYNMPFNATTVFTNSLTSVTHLRFINVSIAQPWVIKSGGIVWEGLQNHTPAFENMGVITGNAFPLVLYPDTPGQQGFKFKNLAFQAQQLQQNAFIWDAEQSSFGLIFDNISFGTNNSNSNLNTPAAVFKGITESAIGVPGNRNSCSAPQLTLGPPCMRFTTVSAATQTAQVAVAGNIEINGFEMIGGGTSYQFDSLPFSFSGGNPSAVAGVSEIYMIKGLREQGHGPFVRVALPGSQGSFWIKNIDDDAGNAAPGNAFVDSGFPGQQQSVVDMEDFQTSVGGQVLAVGNVFATVRNANFSSVGTIGTGFATIGGITTSGSSTVSGTSSTGYLMATSPTPTATLGAGGSCSSNCVPAGSYSYIIAATDATGRFTTSSQASNVVVTDGTKTITVNWTPVSGQVGAQIARNGLFQTAFNCQGATGNVFSDSNVFSYSASFPACSALSGALASGVSSAGVAASTFILAGGFTQTQTGAFTAPRSIAWADLSGTPALVNVAQTWSGNQTNVALVTPTLTNGTSSGLALTTPSIGGETISAAPRGPFNVLVPNALTVTRTAATWTLDKAITVTRVQAQLATPPSGCSTNPVLRLSDGSSNVNLTLTAAANDSGAISQNYAAGAVLTLTVQTPASGCATSPGDANVVAQFKMQ